MPWAIPVPLAANESISSWLARAALLQGCDPLVLTGSICPSWRAWTMDIDRGLSADRLRAVADASGVPLIHLAQAALRTDAERIAGRPLSITGTWPWILTLGSRNRRRHSGQPFCSVCLTNDTHPYFRRHWRFAWHVACAKHGIELQDHCNVCSAPVMPNQLQTEDRHLAQCHRCHTDLRMTDTALATKDALAFQQLADSVLTAGTGSVAGYHVSAVEWFTTARFFLTLIRRTGHREASKLGNALRSVGVTAFESRFPATGLPLEHLAVDERARLCASVYPLVNSSIDTLAAALTDHGVTAAALHDDRSPLPTPITNIMAIMPSGRRGQKTPSTISSTSARSEQAVKTAWARLQRKIRATTS